MTSQEMFDASASHMIRQGQQSINAAGSCLYRTKDGLKCAVGALIPDAEYSPWMEQSGGICELLQAAQHENLMTPTLTILQEHTRLLIRLQDAHDNADLWKNGMRGLLSNFRDIAELYHLNTDAVYAAVAARARS